MDAVHDAKRLAELQALPLSRKIQITQTRIIEWYQHYNGKVVVAFSGGKDSTVLLHIVRQLYPDVPAVFSNTGLEYPEIVKFAHSFPNVDVVTPKMRFSEVISTYGYPLISKEVAEAIYYARRIIRLPTERETQNEHNIQTSGAASLRTLLMGKYPSDTHTQRDTNERKARCRTGGDETRQRRADISGKHGANDGLSQFNKEKYLPLARDIPVPISHYCCYKMKKHPMKQYQHATGLFPFIGTLAEESRLRKVGWIKHGCNAFESGNPTSQPLSFWTEQDILAYIVDYNIQICSVYGNIVCEDEDGNQYSARDILSPCGNLKCSGCDRTGCIFCAFGFHNEKGETRFQRYARTHPSQYEYALCGGQWVDNPAYDPTAPRFDGEWENWNPKKIWVPSKDGIGLRKVFDMVNEIYGEEFYRYE